MTEGSPIRVLIADDHTVLRAGIRLLLQSASGFEVAGEARDAAEAVARTIELKPDIVLLDITMPGVSGLEATAEIVRRCPGPRVVVLTMHEDEEYFFRALSAGASGYLLKDSSPEEMVAALRLVQQGGVYFHPSLGRKLLDDYLRRADSGEERERFGRLTDREREIVRLIAEGRTHREVADLLYLSPRTVERHCANIMEKLNLQNRAELIRYALRNGLVSDGE
ncbi:MAG: response regulator transcription factor [Chloroflexi bacterium]|nr:response regulator transcription factor [Chloroflexota bacterium]